MKLLYQTHSPYARKVLVAAHEMGLRSQLEVIHHETSPTRRNDTVFALNPLGKVPVLVTDDLVLFDSSVICEYLDGLAPHAGLIPARGTARLRALTNQALAQGIADAGIAARWETDRRPEHLRWPAMRDGQLAKIAVSCDLLERQLAADPAAAGTLAAVGHGTRIPDIGAVAVATALGWIEFRNVYPFRVDRPRLASWYDLFNSRASMRATTLSGDTHD